MTGARYGPGWDFCGDGFIPTACAFHGDVMALREVFRKHDLPLMWGKRRSKADFQ